MDKDQAFFKFIITVFGISCIALVFLAYIDWLGQHDKAVEEASKGYESCLMARYHMTPQEYVAEHGAFPQCP